MDHPNYDLLSYPEVFPNAAATAVLVDAFRNREVDVKLAAHIGWHASGFFLAKWDTHQAEAFATTMAVTSMSDEEVAAFLEGQYGAAPQAPGNPLIWLLVAQAIAKLIERLLDKEKQPCPGPGPCEQSS